MLCYTSIGRVQTTKRQVLTVSTTSTLNSLLLFPFLSSNHKYITEYVVMTGAPPKRLQQLSEQLSVPHKLQDAGTFEDIPVIPTIAASSTGPRLQDKVAIITGCNSPLGIGRATAHQFAANACHALYICDFATQHLNTHVRELKSLYPACEVHARQLDAGDEGAVKSVVDEAVAKYGRLDVFFANAGIVGGHHRLYDDESTPEAFMHVMKTNTLS